MTYPFGIDISRYQFSSDGTKKPNFDKINETCAFVAVRAGISWGYVDQWFRYSWEHLDVPRLAYHVVYPGEIAAKQMDHYLNIVKPQEHDRLVLDMELDHGYSKARITDTLLECLEYLKGITGRYPIIYSRASWINQFLDVSRLPVLDWWLAGYLKRHPAPLYTPEATPPPALPRGVNSWLIHQTGERGNGSAVGVVSHYVDCNRFNGTLEQLRAYFGLDEEVPPEPEPPVEVEDKLFDAKVYSWATPYINLRSEPRIAPETDIDNIETGVTLPIYEIVDDWYKTSYKGRNGYVMSRFLERLDYTPPAMLIDIPPLWQRDNRWKSLLLGFSSLTIGDWGCLATNLAMQAGVGVDVFNNRLKAVGGFSGANIYWKMVSVAYPQLEYFKAIDCFYNPAPLDEIDDMLQQGIPVNAHVDFRLDTPQVEQHWVLIIGKNGDDYIINDPWTGERSGFKAKYGDPARYIFRIRAYRRIS